MIFDMKADTISDTKKNKAYKSVTTIVPLFMVFGVIVLVYLALIILKEHKLFSQKYTENIKSIEENIKEREKYIREEFDFIRLGIISINEKNIETEKGLSVKIDYTNRRIATLNEVYNNILKEEKKKRVESLYSDKYLGDKMAEAALLLKEGKINQAYAIYELIAKEQPENKDARFYMYYTLFFKNRSDKEEYPKIKNGFNALEKEGYIRKEMIEVFSYIEAEETHREIESVKEIGE
ncbi:MAG: hypothetical protein FWF38_02905 [Spirochaetaceae bacterium]|nr:hypothetical protein [Spirochaetaceae bacterium]